MPTPTKPTPRILTALLLALCGGACAKGRTSPLDDGGPRANREGGAADDGSVPEGGTRDGTADAAEEGAPHDATPGDGGPPDATRDASRDAEQAFLQGRSAKRGVAYNFCDWDASRGEDDLALLRQGSDPGSGAVWYYNWGPAPADCVANALDAEPQVEFVPMAWGLTGNGTGCESGGACFNDGLSRAALLERIPVSSRFLLGFNEPNFSHQSNLTPAVAARAWQHLEYVADARGLALVAPATNFCDPSPGADHAGSCTVEPDERSVDFGAYAETFPAGHRYNAFAWAELFYDECSAQGTAGHDCRIDYQAGHVYSWWGLGWYVEHFQRKAGLLTTDQAHCENGVEDGDEFGVDCGGNDCAACTAWARAQFAKALWVTEFAPATDDAPAADQAQRVARASEYILSEVTRLEDDDFVFRYAWFMPKTSIASLDHVDLLSETDPVQRTEAGRTYLNLSH